MKLTEVVNIGEVAAAWLTDAGIDTPEKLYELGSKEAFLRLRISGHEDACLSMLQGLEGAVQGVRWHKLDAEKKKELKEFYKTLS